MQKEALMQANATPVVYSQSERIYFLCLLIFHFVYYHNTICNKDLRKIMHTRPHRCQLQFELFARSTARRAEKSDAGFAGRSMNL